MKLGIMQPYFLPYIGYWQLINAVDKFIVYDNIKYTKRGWINRNRFLQNGKDADFTIPLLKDSDFLDIKDRQISAGFNKTKLLNQVKEAYRKAPYFIRCYPFIEKVMSNSNTNLFDFLLYSIKETCSALNINTEITISSSIAVDQNLKSQDRVISICKCLGADRYINSIGGKELYSSKTFNKNGIELKFIRSLPIIYQQFDNAFVPWLSVLDVMMFNDPDQISKMLNEYELI